MDELPDTPKLRARQIRPPVEAAIQLIVTRAVTIAEAAESVGMKGRSLAKALRRGHVADRLACVRREWMESQTSKAWVGVAELADRACSEDVRLKALRTILEAAGELGGGKRDDVARPGVAVQIITNVGGDPNKLSVHATGVVEAPPYCPRLTRSDVDE